MQERLRMFGRWGSRWSAHKTKENEDSRRLRRHGPDEDPVSPRKIKAKARNLFYPPRGGGEGGYWSNENPMMWTRYGISQFSYITVGEFFEDGEIQTLWQLEGLLRSGTRNWMTPVSGSAVWTAGVRFLEAFRPSLEPRIPEECDRGTVS